MQSRKAILQFIETNWEIPDPVIIKSFQTFPTREVLAIKSGGSTFAIKVDSNAPEKISTNSVISYLKERSFLHCPHIIPSRIGEYSMHFGGVLVSIFEYIPVELVTPESWRKLGIAAANLNRNSDYPTEYLVPPLGAIRELKIWGQGKAFEDDFLDIVEKVEPYIGLSTTSGLVHGEINFANARARENGEVVFLDWDDAGKGPIEIELGYPLISVFLNADTLEFDCTSAANFYSGYFSVIDASTLKTETIWAFALLYGLRSMTYFDYERRWLRIQNALERADDLIKSFGYATG